MGGLRREFDASRDGVITRIDRLLPYMDIIPKIERGYGKPGSYGVIASFPQSELELAVLNTY